MIERAGGPVEAFLRGRVLIAIVALILGGCLGSPSDDRDALRASDAGPPEPDAGGATGGGTIETGGEETAPWSLEATFNSTIVLEHSVPGYISGVTGGGCHIIKFDVPDNATRLVAEFTVDGSTGAGYLDLDMWDPGRQDFALPSTEPMKLQRTLIFEDPAMGGWTAWVYAWGVAVMRSYTLALTLEGVGAPPAPLAMHCA